MNLTFTGENSEYKITYWNTANKVSWNIYGIVFENENQKVNKKNK